MPDHPLTAYTGARIFDGEVWHDHAALVVDHGRIHSLGRVINGARTVELSGGLLVPGFVDLQVNGGAGLLVGPGTTAADLATICSTHARFGTTALLPTLITDTPEVTDAVLSEGAVAARQDTAGFLGLHLEGPHLSTARKGAHDPALIRSATEADLVRLERARPLLRHLVVTVAPETMMPEQITRLVRAGIVVSIGHSDASFETAAAAIRAGASMATHLFNSMSQIGNRDPGVAGAALHHGTVSAGLIADGIHVHPATVGLALRAKVGPGQVFLVSDSMSQAGTDLQCFNLNGRTIWRRDGALRLADGTLAGADLTMDAALRYVHRHLGIDLETSLKMGSAYPAKAIRDQRLGFLRAGLEASFIHLSPNLATLRIWVRGQPIKSLFSEEMPPTKVIKTPKRRTPM